MSPIQVVTRLQGVAAPLGAIGRPGGGDSTFVARGATGLVMRVLAASFPDDSAAREARARLLADLALEASQVGVETLADPGDDAAARAVLAGRFSEDLVGSARAVVEQLGGTVMLDIDAAETNA